jgi:AcrR family transcriptional regulator
MASRAPKKRAVVKRRPGGRSARVRTAVLVATVEELAAVGYSELSLDGVARRAGVHRTTLYRRWGTREALILEVMVERTSQAVTVPDTGSLREDLLQLARAAVANAGNPAIEAVIRATVSELRRNAVIAEASRRFWTERMCLDGEIVKRAIARGEVPADTDPRLVIEAVLGPLHLQLLITGTSPEEAVIERVVDIVIDGITSAVGAVRQTSISGGGKVQPRP